MREGRTLLVFAVPILVGLILVGTGILLLIPPWAVQGTYFRWNVTKEGEVKPSVAYVKRVLGEYAEVEIHYEGNVYVDNWAYSPDTWFCSSVNMGFPIAYWTYDDLYALTHGQITFSDYVRELRENRIALKKTDIVIMGKPVRTLETVNMGMLLFVIPIPSMPVVVITFYIHNYFDENTGINVAGEFYVGVGTPESESKPQLFCSWELVDTNANLMWVTPSVAPRAIVRVIPWMLIIAGICVLVFGLGIGSMIRGRLRR